MRNPVGAALIFGVFGLIVGYLIFGRAGGDFVAVTDLVRLPDNIFQEFGQAFRGIREIRRNILISGAVGLGVGVMYSALRRR
ncbi:MAG: hypothetical protein GVY14_05800 [Spirochaetes bacterium]|jgi:hypothetical protein|nr:hypothetical protein [Spirochaetota bacterium]